MAQTRSKGGRTQLVRTTQEAVHDVYATAVDFTVPFTQGIQNRVSALKQRAGSAAQKTAQKTEDVATRTLGKQNAGHIKALGGYLLNLLQVTVAIMVFPFFLAKAALAKAYYLMMCAYKAATDTSKNAYQQALTVWRRTRSAAEDVAGRVVGPANVQKTENLAANIYNALSRPFFIIYDVAQADELPGNRMLAYDKANSYGQWSSRDYAVRAVEAFRQLWHEKVAPTVEEAKKKALEAAEIAEQKVQAAREQAAQQLGQTAEYLRQQANQAQQQAGVNTQQIKDQAGQAAHQVGQKAQQLGDAAGQQAHSAQQTAQQQYQRARA